MIYSLTGKLLEKTLSEAVIECAGVGYLVRVPANTAGALPPVGSAATVYTHMSVSENDVSLYGFATKEEREMFQIITRVSGVGPKVGLAVMSALTPGQIALAVSAGDYKAFTAASGVGPKLAQRMVLELKDKVGLPESGGISLQDFAGAAPAGGAVQQALAALVGLGYTQSEAAAAVNKIDPSLPVAEIIRIALQGMGGKK